MKDSLDTIQEQILKLAYIPPDAGVESPLQLFSINDLVDFIVSYGIRERIDEVKKAMYEIDIRGYSQTETYEIERIAQLQ